MPRRTPRWRCGPTSPVAGRYCGGRPSGTVATGGACASRRRTPVTGTGCRARPSTTPGWSVVRARSPASTAGASRSGPAFEHGFWRMSPRAASLVHADGTPALLVGRHRVGAALARHAGAGRGCTPRDRQAKGFNAVLLMTVQPDMRAVRAARPHRRRGLRRRLRGSARRAPERAEPRLLPVRSTGCSTSWSSTTSSRCCSRSSRASAGRASTWPAPSSRRTSTPGTAATWWPATAPGRRSIWSAPTARATSRRWRPAARRCTRGTRYGQPTGIHYRPHATNRAHQDADVARLPVVPDRPRRRARAGAGRRHVAQHRRPRASPTASPPTSTRATRGRAAGLVAGPRGVEQPVRRRRRWGSSTAPASLWQWRLHADEPGHSAVLPGPGCRLARGAGLRGLDLRRAGRPHPAPPARSVT